MIKKLIIIFLSTVTLLFSLNFYPLIINSSNFYIPTIDEYKYEMSSMGINIEGEDFTPISIGIDNPRNRGDYFFNREYIYGAGSISIKYGLIRNDQGNYIMFYRVQTHPNYNSTFPTLVNNKVNINIRILDFEYEILDYAPKNEPLEGTETKGFSIGMGYTGSKPKIGVLLSSSISDQHNELIITNKSRLGGDQEQGKFEVDYELLIPGYSASYEDLSSAYKGLMTYSGMLKFSNPHLPNFELNINSTFYKKAGHGSYFNYSESNNISSYYPSELLTTNDLEVNKANLNSYLTEFFQLNIIGDDYIPVSLNDRYNSLKDFIRTDSIEVKDGNKLVGRVAINHIMFKNTYGDYIYAYRVISTPFYSNKNISTTVEVKLKNYFKDHEIKNVFPENTPVDIIDTYNFGLDIGTGGVEFKIGSSMTRDWSDIHVFNRSETTGNNQYYKVDYEYQKSISKPSPYKSNETTQYGMMLIKSSRLPTFEIFFGGEFANGSLFKESNYETVYYNGCHNHNYTILRNVNGIYHNVICEVCNNPYSEIHHIKLDPTYTNPNNHKMVCECGYTEYVEHNYISDGYDEHGHYYKCLEEGCTHQYKEEHHLSHVPIDDSRHQVICTDCDYHKIESHNNIHRNHDQNQHTSICTDCNHESVNSHNFSYLDQGNYHRVRCSDCKFIFNEEHNYVYSSNEYGSGHIEGECQNCHHTEVLDYEDNTEIIWEGNRNVTTGTIIDVLNPLHCTNDDIIIVKTTYGEVFALTYYEGYYKGEMFQYGGSNYDESFVMFELSLYINNDEGKIIIRNFRVYEGRYNTDYHIYENETYSIMSIEIYRK